MDLVWTIIGSIIAAAIVYGVTGGINYLRKSFENSIEGVRDDIKGAREDIKNALTEVREDIKNALTENQRINNQRTLDEKIAVMHAYIANVGRWKKEGDLDVAHTLGRVEADLRSTTWLRGYATDSQLHEIAALARELVTKLESDEYYERHYPTQIASLKTISDKFQ